MADTVVKQVTLQFGDRLLFAMKVLKSALVEFSTANLSFTINQVNRANDIVTLRPVLDAEISAMTADEITARGWTDQATHLYYKCYIPGGQEDGAFAMEPKVTVQVSAAPAGTKNIITFSVLPVIRVVGGSNAQ